MLFDTRGSKITGTDCDFTLRGFSRFSVRSAALRPTACGSPRSAPMPRRRKIVVALHMRAFARQHADRDRNVGRRIAAGKAFAGDERHRAAPPTGAGTFAIRDAVEPRAPRLRNSSQVRPAAPTTARACLQDRASATSSPATRAAPARNKDLPASCAPSRPRAPPTGRARAPTNRSKQPPPAACR